MKFLAMAILAGTLIAESANASGVPRPSVPQALPKPHLPQTPSVSINPSVPGVGSVNSAVRDATDFAAAKAKSRREDESGIRQESKDKADAFMKDLEKKRRDDMKDLEKRRRDDQDDLKASKARNDAFMRELEAKRLAKERNTIRAGENKIVGRMPQAFATVSTILMGGDARRVDIDAIVLRPVFIWVK